MSEFLTQVQNGLKEYYPLFIELKLENIKWISGKLINWIK